MTTPRFLSMVSVAALAATLGACAGRATPATENATRPAALSMSFVNEAQTQVDVYLLSDKREWRLGRVAPGSRTMLRIPEAALTTETGFMRLAVLADARLSVDAAHDPHATLTLAQPMSELLAQRWSFWNPRLESPRLLGAAVGLGRR